LYTTLVADTVARYKRQRGFDVFFLTGTDEHGVNIERAAEAAGLPVKQHVDNFVNEFKKAFAPYKFTNNHWVRTTDDYHKRGVAELWRRLREQGWIYRGKYEGWYCANCNEFYLESEAKTGPNEELICPTHERPLDRVSEESYFFKLSAFQDRLLELYEKNPHFIRPETRRNEVISFVKGGLKDQSVSRVSVKWGIPVPDDPDHTMYVWFDALLNYITAIGYGNDQFGGEAHFKKYWPANLQLVGKDILRFHTVYWPAFLLAAGIEPPRTVYSHGMWLSGGRKMSKVLGNVIDLAVLQKYFQTDAVRYFCLREMVFGQDGDFTYEALITRVNADLAKGLGNLSSRILTLVRTSCGGVIPALPAGVGAELNAKADEVREAVRQAVADFDREFDQYNFSRALEAVWVAITRVDGFLSDTKPWNLAKDPAQRPALETVLHTAVEALRCLTVLLAPVLPESTQQIWQQLGQSGSVSEITPAGLAWGSSAGSRIGGVKPVFPNLDKKKIMENIKKDEEASKAARAQESAQPTTEAAAGAATADPAATNMLPPLHSLTEAKAPAATEAAPGPEGVAYIGIEDFAKVELRAGEIRTAERVPKADKLLRFTVDLGEPQPRQILAGIAQYYEPEKLIGRKV